ncbi:hypothetical protein DEA06_15965 [Microbacterium sp. Gd 4-13]|uniref:MmgE/PrpD family protein n=1 Tax=Microbacterium sp. Gd 4-13 TaxID=2173179 RepID=UPI000D578771|nr:MmgE/PrpD family protein [Microbacterium sp. Gd 4-13]PVW02170.1 hypothetical protein DEA06_15965 [Microbacterium sp. Gd 4-13]
MEMDPREDVVAGWRWRLRDRLSRLQLTEPLRRRGASIVADDFAAMIAGLESDPARNLGQTRRSLAGEASLVAGGRAGREQAAQQNAVLCGWNELDEGYRRAGCHGGLYTVPAAMAECEAEDRSLADLLTAVIAGYEVAATVARHLAPEQARAVHPHSQLAPIGAAATIAWLRTSDSDAVLSAAEIAAATSPRGSYRLAREGVLARNLWAGAGASLGFLAADAAGVGIRADARELHDMTVDLEEDDPGWAVEDGYHKEFAACQYAHSAIEAAKLLAETFDTSRARKVAVEAHPLAMTLRESAPTTDLGGKFSVPHLVAAVLVTGRTGADVFGERFLHDSAVVRLRENVEMKPFLPLPPYPLDRPARVAVTLDDGSTHSAECLSARGGPDNPLSESQLFDKIEAITQHRAPLFAPTARQLIAGTIPVETPWRQLMNQMMSPCRHSEVGR